MKPRIRLPQLSGWHVMGLFFLGASALAFWVGSLIILANELTSVSILIGGTFGIVGVVFLALAVYVVFVKRNDKRSRDDGFESFRELFPKSGSSFPSF